MERQSLTGNHERTPLFHTKSLIPLIFLPWLFMTINLIVFTFLYGSYLAVVWTVAGVCALIALFFILVRSNKKGPSCSTPKRYYLTLGNFCVVAIVVGCVCGYFNYRWNMSYYEEVSGMREYLNVLPSEPAISHIDAGLIVFSRDSKIDPDISSGYWSSWYSGSRFCAAPILGNAKQREVEYWGVGLNCCNERGGFTCDQASDPKAHAGLPIVNSDPNVKEYLRAIKNVCDEFQLTSAEDALLLRWVSDPWAASETSINSALGFVVAASLIYLVICTIVGVLHHFTSQPPKRKDMRRV